MREAEADLIRATVKLFGGINLERVSRVWSLVADLDRRLDRKRSPNTSGLSATCAAVLTLLQSRRFLITPSKRKPMRRPKPETICLRYLASSVSMRVATLTTHGNPRTRDRRIGSYTRMNAPRAQGLPSTGDPAGARRGPWVELTRIPRIAARRQPPFGKRILT